MQFKQTWGLWHKVWNPMEAMNLQWILCSCTNWKIETLILQLFPIWRSTTFETVNFLSRFIALLYVINGRTLLALSFYGVGDFFAILLLGVVVIIKGIHSRSLASTTTVGYLNCGTPSKALDNKETGRSKQKRNAANNCFATFVKIADRTKRNSGSHWDAEVDNLRKKQQMALELRVVISTGTQYPKVLRHNQSGFNCTQTNVLMVELATVLVNESDLHPKLTHVTTIWRFLWNISF